LSSDRLLLSIFPKYSFTRQSPVARIGGVIFRKPFSPEEVMIADRKKIIQDALIILPYFQLGKKDISL
jgi:hypothetical protein